MTTPCVNKQNNPLTHGSHLQIVHDFQQFFNVEGLELVIVGPISPFHKRCYVTIAFPEYQSKRKLIFHKREKLTVIQGNHDWLSNKISSVIIQIAIAISSTSSSPFGLCRMDSNIFLLFRMAFYKAVHISKRNFAITLISDLQIILDIFNVFLKKIVEPLVQAKFK